ADAPAHRVPSPARARSPPWGARARTHLPRAPDHGNGTPRAPPARRQRGRAAAARREPPALDSTVPTTRRRPKPNAAAPSASPNARARDRAKVQGHRWLRWRGALVAPVLPRRAARPGPSLPIPLRHELPQTERDHSSDG